MSITIQIQRRLETPAKHQYFLMTVNLLALPDDEQTPKSSVAAEIRKTVLKSLEKNAFLRLGGCSDEFDDGYTATKGNSIEFYDAGEFVLVILLDLNAYSAIGIVTDIKLLILKTIDKFYPGVLAHLDQARLFNIIDAKRDRQKAFRRLDRINQHTVLAASGAKPDGEKEKTLKKNGIETLTRAHLELLANKLERIGPSGFIDLLSTSQTMAMFRSTDSKMNAFSTEYYTNIKNLKKFLLPQVKVWDDATIFAEMTVILDKYILKALCQNTEFLTKPSSINLNVESLFSPDFEKFEAHYQQRLPQLMIEFRFSDVIANLDRYLLAIRRLKGLGVACCIDWVDPRVFSTVDPERFNASLIKVDGGRADVTFSSGAGVEVKRIQRQGCLVALTHVSNERSVEIGIQNGIRLYQGYFVDRSLDSIGEDVANILQADLREAASTINGWGAFIRHLGGFGSRDIVEDAQTELNGLRGKLLAQKASATLRQNAFIDRLVEQLVEIEQERNFATSVLTYVDK